MHDNGPMKVRAILEAKGHHVETTTESRSVTVAIHQMRTSGIGALVVTEDGETIDGIISERDIVRGLAEHTSELLHRRVGDLMEHVVVTCSPDDSIKSVMSDMTLHRVRHIPVIERGRLLGIVSIGDVVKNRLEELELEADVMRSAYLAKS